MNRAGNQKNFRTFYDWLMNICAPSHLDVEERSKRTLPGIVGILSCPVLFGFAFHNFYAGRFILAGLLFFTGVIVLTGILFGRKKADAKVFYRFTMAAVGILFIYLMGLIEVYPHHMFWAFVFPLASLYMLGRREGLLYCIIYYFIVMILVLTQNVDMLPSTYEFRFRIEWLLSLFIVSLISYCFEVIRFQYEETTKRRQASLESSNQQLRQEIEKRKMMEHTTRDALLELKEMQAQLIQTAKLASIGELASGVAHELNQPLMVIRTSAQIQTRTAKKGPIPSKDRIEFLALVEANTKRMMNIINHLRTFSRQAKETFSAVDINKTIEGCLLMVGEQLRLRKIDLKLDLMENIPRIRGNTNQIEQVVLNMVTNARDAVEERGKGPGGTGVIKVTTRVSRKKREWVEILVRDTGKGIPAKNVARVFEPFFTTKEVGKGTGLGLSISYGIIKDHQGEIEVAETGPEGTTFRILLPVSSP